MSRHRGATAGIAALALCAALAGSLAQAAEVSFSRDVLPVLARKCAHCHQGDAAQRGLRLSSAAEIRQGGESGPAVVPGSPDSSLLFKQVSGSPPAMPPAGDLLTEEEIDLLRAWIAAGAPGAAATAAAEEPTRWWSLRPLSAAGPPERGSEWPRAPIDDFLLGAMRTKGLDPSPPAARRALMRRLSYGLTGLPPDPAEMEAFAADPDPHAYERLVDRLLASPAYGERWGRHWLDIARFGESNGYEQNHLRGNAWPYRDWVISAFNSDKPFDRMILEQLAADQISPDDLEAQAATGFLVAGPHDTVGIRNPSGEAQKRANHLDDIVMGTASAFLGLTVHCARCHDHKFDPIQTKDYYRMQAAFAGVWHGSREWDLPERLAAFRKVADSVAAVKQRAERELDGLRSTADERLRSRRDQLLRQYRPKVDAAGTSESFRPVPARFVRMELRASTRGRSAVHLDEISVWTAGRRSRNVALGGKATASATRVDSASPDTYSPANLVDGRFDGHWISGGSLPAWVQIDLGSEHRIKRVEWSTDRLGGFRGRFARPQPEEYEILVSRDGEQWTAVASGEGRLPFSEVARELALVKAVLTPEEWARWTEIEKEAKAAEARLLGEPRPRTAFVGRFEEPAEPSFVMLRGDPMQRGDIVAPASLSTLEHLAGRFELEPDASEGARRMALARWIADDRNALTARVIANRVWMHHFGRGIARNPSDLGLNGGTPSHPDLLDWLADRLVRVHRWRLKPLHRDIVLSAAYRQAAGLREEAVAIDSDGAYLWRFPPRRLSAEELRDSILAASGNLDRRMGGPGFQLYRYTVDNVATYYELDEFPPATYRRSVYHQHARSVKPGLLGEFDCPETSLPAPKRTSTTSPLQALTLLNSAFTLDQAQALAVRAGADRGREPIAAAWRLALGRLPDSKEGQLAESFVAQHGLASLARALLNANEFLYVF
ncbi:MAG: DUF1553 domain-containing protein [Bryobacterales bacterium]|nr:DUF1553 domain-containing protein [Bryobacterales bacterium]